MNPTASTDIAQALDWCSTVLGPVELMADHSKAHGDHESATCRLRTPIGICYLKLHHSRPHWQNEVHAYERWAAAFGDFAPRLLAVHDQTPLALVVSELPGEIVETVQLPLAQEKALWRAAGAALATLHDWATGPGFGPCRRDGSLAEPMPLNAQEYVVRKLHSQIDRALQTAAIDHQELATLQIASTLTPAFQREQPIPCHRDYCAANWLVNRDGMWAGVIDFEFSHWDVRVADFSRDPHWSWIRRPDLVDAFFDGYGRSLTALEAQQLLVARADYALGAILWGRDHSFFGFEREGHAALSHLGSILS